MPARLTTAAIFSGSAACRGLAAGSLPRLACSWLVTTAARPRRAAVARHWSTSGAGTMQATGVRCQRRATASAMYVLPEPVGSARIAPR